MIVPTLLLLTVVALLNVLHAEAKPSYLHFAYQGHQVPVYFDEYESLLGENVLKLCIRREYPPDNGEQCRGVTKVCLWGAQRCGPDKHLEPTSRCNCKNNQWSCQAFLCPTMEGSTCPEKPSLGLDLAALPICKTDLACGYMEKKCANCDVTVPTVQCSCQAGQPFTCQEVDPCSADVKCTTLQDTALAIQQAEGHEELIGLSYVPAYTEAPLMNATQPPSNGTVTEETPPESLLVFPEPIIVDVKNDVPPPPSFKGNNASCPLEAPSGIGSDGVTVEKTTCTSEGLTCQYGYSCCCQDNSQCSADVKCDCIDGVLECKPKVCDAFLCLGPPPLLQTPFAASDTVVTSGLICPSEEDALSTKTCVVEKDMEFYHCVYSFSCCCPNSPSGADFSGRYCSSDLQCTCNAGAFTCDVAECPLCPVDADDVQCPVEKPEHLSVCPNAEGETCGFGQVKCCNGKIHAASYCTCQGNGLWNCFDAKYLCEMEIC